MYEGFKLIDSIKLNEFIPKSICIEKKNISSDTVAMFSKAEQNMGESRSQSFNIDSTVIIPIIIFFLGFIINEYIRRWNKSSELTQYKQFIEEWIVKSKSTLDNYITSLETFSNQIKTNTDLNIAQWRTGIIHLSEIGKIPLEKFSDIYIFGLNKKIDDENRKQLMNFLFQLEYLNKAPSIIMDVYNKYCENNQKIMEEWNVYYMQLLDLIGDPRRDIYNTVEKEIIFSIEELFVQQLKKDGSFTGTDKWKSEFIDPSMIILVKHKNDKSMILSQIIQLIRGLNIVIMKHERLNEYSYVFGEYVSSLKSSQEAINECMKYFEKKKIKRFCS